MTGVPYRKKLIEVALPLAEISEESRRRKQKAPAGYPTTLHRWFGQQPIPACRAIVFATLVDDPSSDPAFAGRTETEQAIERERLFDIIRELVLWENSNNEEILGSARSEIRRCCGDVPPPVLDPFSGSGSIPLEAQRLGLEAHASDLNPVAVLITKALIEIPPRFADRKPVNPEGRTLLRTWSGAEGLANDVRHYGAWMRAEAERRIGHLYPKARLPKEQGGSEATAVAWLWARTVACPNPACGARMPLISSFALSTKKGKETWVEPVVEPGARQVQFGVKSGVGGPPESPKVGRGAKFRCLVYGNVAPDVHIKAEGMAGRMGVQLMAVVAEGPRGRIYVAPDEEQERIAASAKPEWRPGQALANDPRNIWCVQYGLTTFGDLFTDRQLVALKTFSDLVGPVRERALADARAAGLPEDGVPLAEGGAGAPAYADAVTTYLAFALDRAADYGSSLCKWRTKDAAMAATFAQQALAMTWDFAEGNPLFGSSSAFNECVRSVSDVLEATPAAPAAFAYQADAMKPRAASGMVCITDPPYYDNIGYSDLSDFFYIFLRRTIQERYRNLFNTVLSPKSDELIASPSRHENGMAGANQFFEDGMVRAFSELRIAHNSEFPLVVFYAFKQRGDEDKDTEDPKGSHISSPGWETMLEGLFKSGFGITATWPVRSSLTTALKANTNSLASSIVLACRPRPVDAPEATRREFMTALRRELADELAVLLEANIAPVDLAQAVIGPGLAIYTRHSRVVEADGRPMSIRTALRLIDDVLYQLLEGHDERLDADSRFCVGWYEQFGYATGPFGQADVLARAKGVSVDGLQRAGVVEAQGGKVRILRRDEMPADWDPATDHRTPIWECLQHLVRRLEIAGIDGAGELLAQVGDEKGDLSKQLAVRLFEVCDRKKWAADASAYNQFAREFPDIQRAMQDDRARYDAYVREYPEIQRAAGEYRRRALEQGRLL